MRRGIRCGRRPAGGNAGALTLFVAAAVVVFEVLHPAAGAAAAAVPLHAPGNGDRRRRPAATQGWHRQFGM